MSTLVTIADRGPTFLGTELTRPAAPPPPEAGRSKRAEPLPPQPRLRRGEQAGKKFLPPTPFLFARLLETPSGLFGRQDRENSCACPTHPVRAQQSGTPYKLLDNFHKIRYHCN